MARGATVVAFDIEISDVDRGVYQEVALKAAQHPSESPEYLVARVLAHALELTEGLEFSGGLFSGDEPALWVHDLTGRLLAWIEVGTPEPARLHKASKAADRVVVYCHKDPSSWLRTLAAARVHDSERVELIALSPAVVASIAQALQRRNTWSLSRVDATVYLETSSGAHELAPQPLPWP